MVEQGMNVVSRNLDLDDLVTNFVALGKPLNHFEPLIYGGNNTFHTYLIKL